MQLFYAHYPSLEKSFLRLAQHRRPLEPWLVVCASSVMAGRLQAQLARAHGAVANIHFCTVSSLLYRLDSEAGPALPVFPQDHLRDFLLKDILCEPGLNKYPVSRGFVSVLKSALRDLADSLADPDVLEEQIISSPAELFTQDKEQFLWLVRVFKRYQEREANVPGYRPYQALFEQALKQAETSPYLKQFSKIIWYGFYDMPGRQLEFLNCLRSHYSLTAFAPYGDYPAYQFAQKFFGTNWMGTAQKSTDENEAEPSGFGALGASGPYLFAPQGQAETTSIHIISAATPQAEVFFAAKEILRLVEEEHLDFSEIAVLTRAQGPYQDMVRRAFAQNQIPLNSSFSYPLSAYPLGVFCLNLFSLAANGFAREDVLSVVSSPYFRAPQKKSWRKLAEKSLASMQISQWKDLLPQTDGFDPEFLTWLEQTDARLKALAAAGAWAEKCAAARQFLTDNLDETALQGREVEIYQTLCACIDSLAGYGSIRAESQTGEFGRELTEALAALTFNEVENAPRGVVFTDVLRARGLQFKTVFIVGVNEKVFPQIVPEDPILRDYYRYMLRDTWGYWINQQSERVQEERLLFFTACSSATERVYVSYVSRSADGKTMTPSVYVAELARATGQPWNAEKEPEIGARMLEQMRTVSPLFLTPKEVSLAAFLQGESTEDTLHAAGLFTEDTPRQMASARALKSRAEAGSYDGCISSGRAVFDAEQRSGFSPSALQDLAACPMRYFFRKGLHLADKEELLSRHALAPNLYGQVCHRVLEEFYRDLKQQHLTHDLFDSGAVEYLRRAFAKHYTPQSYRRFGIYPVIWDLILTQMREKLETFVQADLRELGNFVPSYFERAFEELTIKNEPFTLRGVIDRIDVNPQAKTFRIVDYKSSRKCTKDLAQSFFTHLIFQPVLYVLAAQQLPELAGMTSAGSCLLVLKTGYEKCDLSVEEFTAILPRVHQFLQLLADIVIQGKFVLCPSDLCTYCPYSAICRKDSFACLMRARNSKTGKQVEEARYGTD